MRLCKAALFALLTAALARAQDAATPAPQPSITDSLKIELKSAPDRIEIGEDLGAECAITWKQRLSDEQKKDARKLAEKTGDENFEVRAQALAALETLLRTASPGNDLEALTELGEKIVDIERTTQLQNLKARLEKRKKGERANDSILLSLSTEIQALPEQGEPYMVNPAPEHAAANPFLVEIPKINFGERRERKAHRTGRLPPGHYRMRVRLNTAQSPPNPYQEDRQPEAERLSVNVATEWHEFRVDAREVQEAAGLLNVLPKGWVAIGSYGIGIEGYGLMRSNPCASGWQYSGPVKLDDLFRKGSSIEWAVASLPLGDLTSWQGPTGDHAYFDFERSAELRCYPLDFECVPVKDAEQPALYLGATKEGRWFLSTKGKGCQPLVDALKVWCTENAAQPARATRGAGDLSERLKTRAKKDELFDWLAKARTEGDGFSSELLRAYPLVNETLDAETETFLRLAEGRFQGGIEYEREVSVFLLKHYGAKSRDALKRLVENKDEDVRARAIDLLTDMIWDHETGFSKDAELADCLVNAAGEVEPRRLWPCVRAMLRHEALAPAMAPVLVEGVWEQTDGGAVTQAWEALLNLMSDDHGWAGVRESVTDVPVVEVMQEWWRTDGVKRDWPRPAWAAKLTQRLKDWKQQDGPEPAQ
ncbi:MAG: hypothetical protein HY291_05915 [Planctomycetes bacterium]|nr:hypothetical protein [Planctomycetota bacterium]